MRLKDLLEDLEGIHTIKLYEATPEDVFLNDLELGSGHFTDKQNVSFICSTGTEYSGIRPYRERRVLRWETINSIDRVYATLEILLEKETGESEIDDENGEASSGDQEKEL